MRTGVRTQVVELLMCRDSWLCVCACVSDCPQVQCVEQYTAQQSDELTLEPTEIINIIRKTNEGTYAPGIRLFIPFNRQPPPHPSTNQFPAGQTVRMQLRLILAPLRCDM